MSYSSEGRKPGQTEEQVSLRALEERSSEEVGDDDDGGGENDAEEDSDERYESDDCNENDSNTSGVDD